MLASANNTSTPEYWFQKGLLIESKNNWIGAAESYRKAIQIDPRHILSHYNLAHIYTQKNQLRLGIRHFLIAGNQRPVNPDDINHQERSTTLDALYNAASLYQREGAFQKASRVYQDLLDIDPNYADALFNIAQCYKQLGLLQHALTHWQRYLQFDTSSRWANIARTNIQWISVKSQSSTLCEA